MIHAELYLIPFCGSLRGETSVCRRYLKLGVHLLFVSASTPLNRGLEAHEEFPLPIKHM
jgi:hypothetical protein